MATRFVLVDRKTPLLLSPDLREWVDRDDLVHLVIELVESMDLREAVVNERGTGSEQYPPGMMLALLILSYANGVFSSRKIERMTHQNVATRYLTGDTHPDHDTIASFRRKNDALIRSAFVQLLQIAREMKLLRVGTVHIDGTKILANASKRRTMGEAQLQEELDLMDQAVARGLLQQAEQADQSDDDSPYRLPKELQDAATRKAKLEAARLVVQERKRQASARAKEQTVNTTDQDSIPMRTAEGPRIQGYNAQLAVDEGGLIVGGTVINRPGDRQELVPTFETIPSVCGPVEKAVADTGYDNSAQVRKLQEQHGVMVYCPPQESTRAPSPLPERSLPRRERLAERKERRERMNTPLGQTLLYQRRTTIEPIFGILKQAFGFRRFSVRGLSAVRNEWKLLSVAFNCWRIWKTAAA